MAKQLKKGASSDMQRVTPTFTTTDHGYDTPHLDRMPPFVLVYNPRRWTVLAGRLIPSLHVKPLEAGVNGVAIARDGTIRFATARARASAASSAMAKVPRLSLLPPSCIVAA